MIVVAVGALLILCGLVVALVVARRRRTALPTLLAWTGQTVTVSRAPAGGAAVVWPSIVGVLVDADASRLVMRPKTEALPEELERLREPDGTVRIPMRDVVDVTCAGEVVRIR